MTGGEFSEAQGREDARGGLRAARLGPRPQARRGRGHVVVRRGRGRHCSCVAGLLSRRLVAAAALNGGRPITPEPGVPSADGAAAAVLMTSEPVARVRDRTPGAAPAAARKSRAARPPARAVAALRAARRSRRRGRPRHPGRPRVGARRGGRPPSAAGRGPARGGVRLGATTSCACSASSAGCRSSTSPRLDPDPRRSPAPGRHRTPVPDAAGRLRATVSRWSRSADPTDELALARARSFVERRALRRLERPRDPGSARSARLVAQPPRDRFRNLGTDIWCLDTIYVPRRGQGGS